MLLPMNKPENSLNPEERRAHKRISYWLLAQYKQKGSFLHTGIKNISKGGLLMLTKEPISTEENLTVQIYLPSTKGYDKLLIQVKPAWQKKSGSQWLIGVAYVNLSKTAEDLLSNFINYLIMLKNISKGTTPVPYWCITSRTSFMPAIAEKKEPEAIILIESSKNYSEKEIIVLNIKLPTYTMPFNIEGSVIKSIYDDKLKTYFVSLGLHNLSIEQLEAIKKFSLDK